MKTPTPPRTGLKPVASPLIAWARLGLHLGVVCLAPSIAAADEPPAPIEQDTKGMVLSIAEENDLVAGTDRHYTQGLRYTQMFDRGGVNVLGRTALSWIPEMGTHGVATNEGFTFGQEIYTPSDISVSAPIPNDRPYAGWLFIGQVFQTRGLTGEIPTDASLELMMGVTGPPSLGSWAQITVHTLRGFPLPQGWVNQIHTEPGLMVKYGRQWLFRAGHTFTADFMPEAGVTLGNIMTDADLGATLRLGINTPPDFTTPNIQAHTFEDRVGKRTFGAYLFAGVEGRAIGRNIFLDGNSFQSSPRIAKDYLVGDGRLGLALLFKNAELSYTHVFRTKEFHGQKDFDVFGSIALKVVF